MRIYAKIICTILKLKDLYGKIHSNKKCVFTQKLFGVFYEYTKAFLS